MILYVFITHQENIEKCYNRISDMMVDDFVIIQGGFYKEVYDPLTKILSLNCDDRYVGLPEKIIKTFNYLINDKLFDKYTHFCKLDDDMIVVKRFENINDDYLGNVSYQAGSRTWHRGKCGNFWDNIPYSGEFVPWCMGGYGYIVSKKSLVEILPNFNYTDHIYEDVYLGLLMNNIEVSPNQINNISDYLVSPDHK